MRLKDDTLTVEANDARCTLERAQHEHDPAVLPQVRNRLRAAADIIEIRQRTRVEHAKRIEPFRRQIDVASGAQGRRSHEKHLLSPDECFQTRVDLFECLAHADLLDLNVRLRVPWVRTCRHR